MTEGLRPALWPWLQQPLTEALSQLRSHAALLHGPDGVGQFEFALALARAWLCEARPAGAPAAPACGRCASCHLVEAGSHPDLMVILPEALQGSLGWGSAAGEEGSDSERAGKARKPSQEIKVDAIRQVVQFSHHTASRGRAKVVLVHPVERMNLIAANTLLKTLEEPPGQVRFVLSGAALDQLLPTVRSRCQAWRLSLPEADVAARWLCDVVDGLDQTGAEVLLVTPSADFFSEPHVDSLIGYAKVFHAAGVSWTLSSYASEAANFGLFIGSYDQMRKVALRIREAAMELGVKRIVVGECGHAWRVAYSFWNTLIGVGAGPSRRSNHDSPQGFLPFFCFSCWALNDHFVMNMQNAVRD